MATTGFAVTYERLTEQDAEADETDDKGFVIQNCSLSDAICLGLEYSDPSWAGACEPSDSRVEHARWLMFYRWNNCTRENIEKGIDEQRSLHIPDHVNCSITAADCSPVTTGTKTMKPSWH